MPFTMTPERIKETYETATIKFYVAYIQSNDELLKGLMHYIKLIKVFCAGTEEKDYLDFLNEVREEINFLEEIYESTVNQ